MVSLTTDRIFNTDGDMSLVYDEVYTPESPNKLTTSHGPSSRFETRNYHAEYDIQADCTATGCDYVMSYDEHSRYDLKVDPTQTFFIRTVGKLRKVSSNAPTPFDS